MFVVVALLALLVIPALIDRIREDERLTQLEPAQDARGVVNDLRQLMSEEEAAYRGFLLTGNAAMKARLLASEREEDLAFASLARQATQLSPALRGDLEALRTESLALRQARRAWLAGAGAESAADIAAHERLVVHSDRVRRTVLQAVRSSQARIQSLDRAAGLLTLVLSACALAAAILVIQIGRRFRRQALVEAQIRAAALALAQATEVSDVLSSIASAATNVVQGSSSFVERVEKDGAAVCVVASSGKCVLAPGTRLPFPGSLTQACLQSGRPETFRVHPQAERPSAARLSEVCDGCAGLVVPLNSAGAATGALVVVRPGARSFPPAAAYQLRIFGAFAALALNKATLLEQARAQQRELARAAELRERMVRGFSHDLKNPLGAADGNAALLEAAVAGELSAPQLQQVSRIRRSLHTALRLIDDVVELARAEAGQLPIREGRVDVEDLVHGLAADYRAAASAAGLELVEDARSGLPAVRTDPVRVQQVLGNLLSNAIKYTPRGGRVRLSAAVRRGRRSGDPRRWLTVLVQDDGPGIPEEHLPRLFQEFTRVGTTAVPGAGLGLAISDRVARLLGGEITVASGVGRGSAFTLWLPCDECSAQS